MGWLFIDYWSLMTAMFKRGEKGGTAALQGLSFTQKTQYDVGFIDYFSK